MNTEQKCLLAYRLLHKVWSTNAKKTPKTRFSGQWPGILNLFHIFQESDMTQWPLLIIGMLTYTWTGVLKLKVNYLPRPEAVKSLIRYFIYEMFNSRVIKTKPIYDKWSLGLKKVKGIKTQKKVSKSNTVKCRCLEFLPSYPEALSR